jgi:hypothetical protein
MELSHWQVFQRSLIVAMHTPSRTMTEWTVSYRLGGG